MLFRFLGSHLRSRSDVNRKVSTCVGVRLDILVFECMVVCRHGEHRFTIRVLCIV
jgi:hypothetical protein